MATGLQDGIQVNLHDTIEADNGTVLVKYVSK